MVSLRNAFLVSAPLLCGGCNPAFWGNLGVLGVTIAIFLGTVFLSRSSEASRSAARSASSSTASALSGSAAATVPAAANRAASPASGRS